MGIHIIRAVALTIVVAVCAPAQVFTDFRFSANEVGWNQDFVGVVNNGNRTITFTTQKWVENIDRLRASFTIDGGGGQAAVNGAVQTSGQSAQTTSAKTSFTP